MIRINIDKKGRNCRQLIKLKTNLKAIQFPPFYLAYN